MCGVSVRSRLSVVFVKAVRSDLNTLRGSDICHLPSPVHAVAAAVWLERCHSIKLRQYVVKHRVICRIHVGLIIEFAISTALMFLFTCNYFSLVMDQLSHWVRLSTPWNSPTRGIPSRDCPVVTVTSNVWFDIIDIQSSPSLPVFRQRLKTFLFRQSFPDIVLWRYYASVVFVIVLLFKPH